MNICIYTYIHIHIQYYNKHKMSNQIFLMSKYEIQEIHSALNVPKLQTYKHSMLPNSKCSFL